LSLAVALVFGAGAALMLRRDLISLWIGTSLLSNAAFLFLAGAVPGLAPIHPVDAARAADAVGQSLALTGLVINLGTTAVLLALIRATWASHGTLDLDDLAGVERDEEREGGDAP
jgi:multicomponent Na+:H+ antiporter subunit C